ncbi:MAG: hypothetical protein H0T89_37165 [Deltaproteobacteria bacterium]|nr:hypothetical protein [Deltaproteobacteria bacterium]MDQ3295702.1 hypothetical protein [Myxococcota bacterium]
MRRIIPITLLALTLFGGTAMADRGRWRQDTSDRSGGVIVRDHRHRVHRDDRVRPRKVFHRRPVYATNGRFVFNSGITRTYTRPVIRVRYQDYRYRPQPIHEHCDPVAGYTWVDGSWTWNGYEWQWTAGYYAPDPQYQDSYYGDTYQDPYYQQQTYEQTYQQPVYQQPVYQQPTYQQPTYQQPYVRGGVTIQGGIRF